MAEHFRNSDIQPGVVRFPGNEFPRPESLTGLERAGYSIRPLRADDAGGWAIEVAHPDHGTGQVLAVTGGMTMPEHIVEHAPNLSEPERELARSAGVELLVNSRPIEGHALRDRKRLLRLLSAVMGDEGVLAHDAHAWRCWSREELDEELSHDAELDVSALFIVHAVTEDADPKKPDDEPPVRWVHTHGLADMGVFDFDILSPSEGIMDAMDELVRVIAYAIIEEAAKVGEVFEVAGGHPVRLVSVEEFQARALHEFTSLREHDEHHNERRVVLGEPPAKGIRSLLVKNPPPRPSKFLSTFGEEDMMLGFSDEATESMARRARGTMSLLAKARAGVASIDHMCLVKLGYETDAGRAGGREHLWFHLHDITDAGLDATLLNQPFDIRAMRQGQRRTHSVERLTDWQVQTPMGTINPRSTTLLRSIARDPAAFEAMCKILGMVSSPREA